MVWLSFDRDPYEKITWEQRRERTWREIRRRWKVSRDLRARLRNPLLLAVVFTISGLALYRIPINQTRGIADPAKRFELENQARGTVAAALGGAAVLLGAWAALRDETPRGPQSRGSDGPVHPVTGV